MLNALLPGDVLAGAVRSKARDWLIKVRERAADLRASTLSAVAWQEEMERLAGDVSPEDVCAAIDLDALAKKLSLPEDRASTIDPVVPGFEGAMPYQLRMFGLRQGTAIVPHGHRKMASMHLVLRGEFRVRHYQRLGDDDAHITLVPAFDRVETPGGRSSISDQRDNVHWLIATRGPAYTLDVIVRNLEGSTALEYLDIDGAHAGPNGSLIAPRITSEQAFRKYGRA
ncbi:MAG: hypothetical protein QM723_26575 [Myxococcaceae bacterium]